MENNDPEKTGYIVKGKCQENNNDVFRSIITARLVKILEESVSQSIFKWQHSDHCDPERDAELSMEFEGKNSYGGLSEEEKALFMAFLATALAEVDNSLVLLRIEGEPIFEYPLLPVESIASTMAFAIIDEYLRRKPGVKATVVLKWKRQTFSRTNQNRRTKSETDLTTAPYLRSNNRKDRGLK